MVDDPLASGVLLRNMFLIYAGGVVLPLALAYGAMPRNGIEPSQLKVQEEGAGPVDTGKNWAQRTRRAFQKRFISKPRLCRHPTHPTTPLSPVRYSPFAGFCSLFGSALASSVSYYMSSIGPSLAAIEQAQKGSTVGADESRVVGI